LNSASLWIYPLQNVRERGLRLTVSRNYSLKC